MHNHLHVISSCRVLTPDSKSKNLNFLNKRTFSCIIHLQPLFLLKESIYKNHLEFSQIKDHLQRPIYPLSPVSYWPAKPSFVLAHQAQFRTGPPSPVLSGPSSPVSYWPPSPVLSGPPSPVSYWSTKTKSVLLHQVQFRIGPQS